MFKLRKFPSFLRPKTRRLSSLRSDRRAEVNLKSILLGILVLGVFIFLFITPGFVTNLLRGDVDFKGDPVKPEPGSDTADEVKFKSSDALADSAVTCSSAIMWVNNLNPSPLDSHQVGSISTDTITFSNGPYKDGDTYMIKAASSGFYTVLVSGVMQIQETSNRQSVQGDPILLYGTDDGSDIAYALSYASTDLDATAIGSEWAISASTEYTNVEVKIDGNSMANERSGWSVFDPDVAPQKQYDAFLIISNNHTDASVEFKNLEFVETYSAGTTEYWVAKLRPDQHIVQDSNDPNDGSQTFLIDITFGTTQVSQFSVNFYDYLAASDVANRNYGTAALTVEYIYTD